MNVWAESIANLQRRRGPPLDLVDAQTITCKKCGQDLPETSFYIKHRRDGSEYRRPVCGVCESTARAAARPHKPRPIPHREIIHYVLTKEPMSMAEIAKTMGISRRTVHKNVMDLLKQGRVFFYENRWSKYNPTIPTFWIQPKASMTPERN